MVNTVEEVFEGLVAGGAVTVAPRLADSLAHFAINVEDGIARLDEDVALLDPGDIVNALGEHRALAQGMRLEVLAHVDSTNTRLIERAASESIHQCVMMAEVQTGGRGRRGRTWLSPFGRNLAMSVGLALRRPPAEVGALSLVVGLAIADALEESGLSGIGLKWPNDVMLGGRKLCGILIELVSASAPAVVVIGAGVNVGGVRFVADAVDQEIADVVEQLPDVSRSRLAGAILGSVLRYAEEFDESGFGRFRDRWLARHAFHGEAVAVATPSETFDARCVGVSVSGGLIVEVEGTTRELIGGEISMRRKL